MVTPSKTSKRPTSARARALGAKPVEPMPGEFIAMDKWDGPRHGMIYKVGAWGPGSSVTQEETSAYVAWNREHGCVASGTPTGPNLVTPTRSTPGPARSVPKARALNVLDDVDEQEAEQNGEISVVC